MRTRYLRMAIGLALAVVLVLLMGATAAADHNGYRVADGVTVYYAVIPAAMLRRFPEGSPEAIEHANIPPGKHVHHLLVALFEGDEMQRITDAEVIAWVREVGLAWKSRHLEPMTLNGALTYCNYFTLYDHTLYRIEIDVRRPEAAEVMSIRFEYRNP